MMGDFWLLKSKDDVDQRLAAFADFLKMDWNWDKPVCWQIEAYSPRRSLSQNSLFHMWVREICIFLIEQKKVETPSNMKDLEQDIKDLLCFKFLGTKDKQVGMTLIPGQVVRTSTLDTGEMYFFMNQVQDWALDLGMHLSHPENSDYMVLQKQSSK